MSNTPGRVKIGFSVFVSILLIGVLPESTIEYGGVIEYATIVVKEGITGLLIGFGANICNSIVLFAGNIMDLNMGLSMATEYDPVSKTNSPITGNFIIIWSCYYSCPVECISISYRQLLILSL